MTDTPDAKVESDAPVSEKLAASDWPERSSWFTVDGASVSRHAIVGALYDVEPETKLTQSQVQKRVERFLNNRVGGETA